MKLPSSQDLMGTYLTQLVAAAVIAVVLWLLADTVNAAQNVLAFFIDSLIMVLVGMLIAYAIVAVVSSDALVAKMNESGLFSSLNDTLGYAMVISLGSIILNLLFFFNWNNWWGNSALDLLNSVIFLLLLLISALALLFFLTVITKLLQISKLRMA
ncbi:MAG: hypothetical protein PHW93_03990 [Candidatus Methanomethylophilaceae archaeon]|nr:hypothetical protein [Candidatus Methanomethylophilaceae archaeon]